MQNITWYPKITRNLSKTHLYNCNTISTVCNETFVAGLYNRIFAKSLYSHNLHFPTWKIPQVHLTIGS